MCWTAFAVMVDSKPKPCGPAAVTVEMVTDELASAGGDLHDWLRDRKNRRSIPHRFASCGYLPVRNNDRNDGLWIIKGKRLSYMFYLAVAVRLRWSVPHCAPSTGEFQPLPAGRPSLRH